VHAATQADTGSSLGAPSQAFGKAPWKPFRRVKLDGFQMVIAELEVGARLFAPGKALLERVKAAFPD
jgi:hypothetical protein